MNISQYVWYNISLHVHHLHNTVAGGQFYELNYITCKHYTSNETTLNESVYTINGHAYMFVQ